MEMQYPLHWPPGQKRTDPILVSVARFQTSGQDAIGNINAQLARLGAKNAELTTNLKPNRFGRVNFTDANRLPVEERAVALYFTREGKDYCFACDRWKTITDNIHAIGKTIEAIRGIERWGSAQMVDQAFTGYLAIPETSGKRPWYVVLGVPHGADARQVDDAYRKLARRYHPDNPDGDAHKFMEVSEALEEYNAHIIAGALA